MKHPLRWTLVVLVLLGLSTGVFKAISNKKAQQKALAQSSASANSGFVQLSPSDWIEVQARPLTRTLPIAGTITALNTAIVKAKVASELLKLNVREGQSVTQGQVLGQLDPQEFQTRLKQAHEQVATAQAQLQIAQQTLDNNRALVQQGFISKNALDTSTANANAAQANVRAAQAAAELAQKSLRDTQLMAPISGLISQRWAQAGERVGIDARIIEIVDLSQLELEASLSPEDLAMTRMGQMATIHVDGLGAPVLARLARINPSTTPGTRNIPIYLALQPQPGLRHGLYAQGSIQLERHTAMAVPAASVKTEGQKTFVLLIQGQKAVRREVRTGPHVRAEPPAPQSPDLIEIVEGLQAGDRVLRESVNNLPDGAAIRFSAAQAH